MKGRIFKTEDYGWLVAYNDAEGLFRTRQLHPDNVNEILEWEKVFDNIEARISAHPDVEFEMVEHQKMDGVTEYAKLIYEDLSDWDVTLNDGLEDL